MMTNVELMEMIRKNDELSQFSYTKNLKATYFVTREGKKLSFGYEYGCRTNDHRIIFSMIENVEYNDFKSLIEKTGLLVYMPESNDGLYLKNLELSDAQKKFVEENDVEMIYE